MALPDPRRLAAVDMYGIRGTARRRHIVRAEFIAGACASSALGVLTLVRSSGAWVALGAWLVGVGLNYVVLALEAQRLSRPGALDAEMAGLEPRGELRRATKAQLWIALPLAICLAALVRTRRPRRG
jgi:hypothetical protein